LLVLEILFELVDLFHLLGEVVNTTFINKPFDLVVENDFIVVFFLDY
jgi:hypothetical protein